MTSRQAVGWLVLVCAVWGVSFVVVKGALGYVSPLMLMAIRFGIATAIIAGSLRGLRREELVAGVILGVLFWSGFAFQTFGLRHTTPSRSAFITILSTPLVPVVHYLIYRSVPRASTVGAVLLAVVGTYLLTSPGGGFGLNYGDVLTLGCAVLFAGQIVAVGHFAPRLPITRLLALELGVAALLSLAASPLLETPTVVPNRLAVAALLFLGLSGLWSFYMQLRTQQVLSPTHTALVFTLEPVFASFASYLIFAERLTPVQLAGGALILAAVAAPALERPATA
ncbi:MAG: DMT family transporter [Gemmatimonadales bacterium]